jgi:hypothetical protein
MILVIDLRRRDEDENSQRGEILDSLFKARMVWKEARDHSAMAMNVYTVLSNMLQSLSVVESAGIEPIFTLPVENLFDAGQFVVPTEEEENIDFGTEMDIDWVSNSPPSLFRLELILSRVYGINLSKERVLRMPMVARVQGFEDIKPF